MSAQDDPSLPKEGDVLAGKYRIERVLGRGGMGIVYAAHHEVLAQRVAVKLLLSEIATNQEVVARFLNEARSAARIESDHVARVMDVGTIPNPAKPDAPHVPYIVMEFLEGVDLAQLLESRGPLALTDAVDHVLQALEALAQAHLCGIVHRDLKPANLFMVSRRDGNPHVKVLDFGISKVTNPFAGAAKTSTSSMLGTPHYMSPEQLRNAKDVDARADIWSLGVVLHELLTGTPPFGGETLGELLMAIVERDPPSLRGRRPDVPAAFDEVVWRCLRRNPAERYASAAELACALAPFGSARGAISSQRILAAMQEEATDVKLSPARSSASPGLNPSASPLHRPGATALLTPSPPLTGPPYSAPGAPFGSPTVPSNSSPVATAGAWGGTQDGARTGGGGRGAILAVAALVGVVGIGAGVFAVHGLMSKGAAVAAGVSSASGLTPVLPPSAEPVAEPAASGAAVGSATPVASAAPGPSTSAALPLGAGSARGASPAGVPFAAPSPPAVLPVPRPGPKRAAAATGTNAPPSDLEIRRER